MRKHIIIGKAVDLRLLRVILLGALMMFATGCSLVPYSSDDIQGVALAKSTGVKSPHNRGLRKWSSRPSAGVLGNSMDKGGSLVIGRVIPPTESVDNFPPIVIPEQPEVDRMLVQITTKERRCLQQRFERGEGFASQIGKILQEHGVPADFVNLALLESAFNPAARSPNGAVGLWQFTKTTARNYGLIVNQKVDERRDPIKSTHAAAEHLTDLFDIYGDWQLALAAYNAGVGRVNRAMEAGKTDDFFELSRRNLLAKETQDFVPRFMALAKISRSPEQFGFDVPHKLALQK